MQTKIALHALSHTHRLLTIAVVELNVSIQARTHITHKPFKSVHTHTHKEQGAKGSCVRMSTHQIRHMHQQQLLGPHPRSDHHLGRAQTRLGRTRPTKPNREKETGMKGRQRERLEVNRNTLYDPNGNKIQQTSLGCIQFKSVCPHTH